MNDKSKYNPQIHHRKSIRLKGYDYSQAGLYFITICCQDRACLFGKINNGEMGLNDAGTMVNKWFSELENKYSDIKCHEMIVMPNHFHCIVQNVGTVGADLRICADDRVNEQNENGQLRGIGPNGVANNVGNVITNVFSDNVANANVVTNDVRNVEGEHVGSPLHRVVQWFKTMTTNEYIRGVKTLDWKLFHGKLWQRNYHEHIIRNEKSYQNISNYIINNPAKWNVDKFYNK